MSHVLQETVTGSTLNGRKEYLKADEGDKDKWEFLNFADTWTPSEMVLPAEGNTGNVKEDVFFTHVSPMQEFIGNVCSKGLFYQAFFQCSSKVITKGKVFGNINGDM